MTGEQIPPDDGMVDYAAKAAEVLPDVLAHTTVIVGIASDVRARLVEQGFSPEDAGPFVLSYLLNALTKPPPPTTTTEEPT